MIVHRFLLQLNSLLFGPDRGSQRVALGFVAAVLIVAPSMSALPSAMVLTGVALLILGPAA